jgi:hypothetical protein
MHPAITPSSDLPKIFVVARIALFAIRSNPVKNQPFLLDCHALRARNDGFFKVHGVKDGIIFDF